MAEPDYTLTQQQIEALFNGLDALRIISIRYIICSEKKLGQGGLVHGADSIEAALDVRKKLIATGVAEVFINKVNTVAIALCRPWNQSMSDGAIRASDELVPYVADYNDNSSKPATGKAKGMVRRRGRRTYRK